MDEGPMVEIRRSIILGGSGGSCSPSSDYDVPARVTRASRGQGFSGSESPSAATDYSSRLRLGQATPDPVDMAAPRGPVVVAAMPAYLDTLTLPAPHAPSDSVPPPQIE